MLECEAHHYLDGSQPPAGWWRPNSARFTLRRRVMVDPIANADIEIPVLTVAKANHIAPATPCRHRAGLAKLVNLPATS
jgi:hypothetical protein